MTFRLPLSESRFPVQTFFNAIADSSFFDVIERLSKGVGSSINECHCTFPGDLDPADEPFEGVCFSIFDDEIIVTKQECVSVVQTVCADYLKKYPERRTELERILRQF
ncbi:MAG: ribonuclease toxin immunity protein CdiI [Planctomycetota bacterium]|nr:ribonuclease toxin immunity protein CdiI [Planctomycetota bacterium]